MPKLITEKNYNITLKNAKRCKDRGIILPTIKQQINPETIPINIKNQLSNIGLWDINPLNLFRITWKNDIKTGLFGKPNFFELPSSLTGVPARIIGMVGKYFPTGAHKVGAAYGCLVPRLVSGTFDPETQKAVWPSTGNYCRGGAFDCALLACPAVAILPEEKNYNIILKNAKRCKERGVILPTIKQQINPETIPNNIKNQLSNIGLWDINPLNLFRITWKNDIKTGLFGKPNF